MNVIRQCRSHCIGEVQTGVLKAGRSHSPEKPFFPEIPSAAFPTRFDPDRTRGIIIFIIMIMMCIVFHPPCLPAGLHSSSPDKIPFPGRKTLPKKPPSRG
ncbi:hypothetical protein CLAIMM_14385 [Cladophialophora immunda]|nr:hypothetical protein CLAIMM_14385 [Cladophialophora immunda]